MIVTFGLLTAILVCYADDVRMLISMGMLLLMFISGIFFDISSIREPVQSYLLTWNPLAFLCDSFRKTLMQKGMYSIDHMLALLAIFSSAIAGLHLLYRNMSRVLWIFKHSSNNQKLISNTL